MLGGFIARLAMEIQRRLNSKVAKKLLKAQKFRTSSTVLALILREMATTYGRTKGGYIWALLEPVAAIALLSFAFSLAFRSPSLGISFPLFYATGFLPFHMYKDVGSKVSASIAFSRPLLRYPAVTFIDAIFARFLLNFATHVMVFYFVMLGVHLFLDVRSILNIPAILLSLSMAGALALGIGVLNCFLIGRFPVWQRVWTIINRPLFIASTVLFVFEDVPGVARDILWYNPLIHVVGAMRRGFYPSYDAAYISPAYVFAISLTCLALGLLLLRRFHRELVNL